MNAFIVCKHLNEMHFFLNNSGVHVSSRFSSFFGWHLAWNPINSLWNEKELEMLYKHFEFVNSFLFLNIYESNVSHSHSTWSRKLKTKIRCPHCIMHMCNFVVHNCWININGVIIGIQFLFLYWKYDKYREYQLIQSILPIVRIC